MNRKNQILTFTISTVLLVILSGTAFGDLVEPVDPVNIEIDIKPGSYPNSINNNGKGVIPVAILGSADFDVTEINPDTVKLGECGIKKVGKKDKLLAHIENVNGDAFDDLVVQIEDDCDFVGPTATLTGNLFEEYDSTPFVGNDSIRLVPE